jgi:hypothetical protein
MPFARFESSAEAETHNNNQRSNAKMRWAKLQQERRQARARKPAAQNQARKPAARLATRLADYARFIDDNKGDAKVRMRRESGGFHKPGSMQK